MELVTIDHIYCCVVVPAADADADVVADAASNCTAADSVDPPVAFVVSIDYVVVVVVAVAVNVVHTLFAEDTVLANMTLLEERMLTIYR